MLTTVIVAFILLELAVTKIAAYLNLKTWDLPIPTLVANLYSQEKYKKAKDYAIAGFNFSIISALINTALLLAFLLLGGFAYTDNLVRHIAENPVLQTLCFLGILGVASFVISLPFDIYSTFVIEQKFGFNNTTPLLFFTDKVKGLLLTVVLGGGLLALITWVYYTIGSNFWWMAWAIVFGFSLFMVAFYTSWLLPLFNKLTPLADGELKHAVEEYATKVQFALSNIFVMDGSKRSSKANAFFSGIGKQKNIVLYDSLINDLTTEEITAVLAHEVGHYKKRHVFKMLVLSALQMGIMFYLFGWLSSGTFLQEGLGVKLNSFHISLITFSMLYSPVSLITGLGVNYLSRVHEYEADSYAAETYESEHLITALQKLSVNHLSNLQPHPMYVTLNYSHPTLLQRISNLRKHSA